MEIRQSITTPNSTRTERTEPKRDAKLDPTHKRKLEKAVREFESVFVGYLLKSMRNTIEKADNSGEEYGGGLLEGMFDVELAQHMSKSSNIGLAQMLYRKLTGEELPAAHRTGGFGIEAAKEALSAMSREMSMSAGTPLPYAGLVQKKQVRDAHTATAAKVPDSLHERLDGYSSIIAEASEKHGVSESLIKAVIATESHAQPDARSAKEAKGLMQLIDSTAVAMGVKNVWDPRENILGGTRYLSELLERFDGDEALALAGYNAGPANVVKHGGVPPFRETKQYVSRVMNFQRLFDKQGGEE